MPSRSMRLQDHFRDLTDPRRRKVVYPLINVVTIAVRAVIAGADDFVSIAAWGRQKRDWLATVLDLSRGIPSHDRINAIFAAINPAEFERCLLSWITAPHEVTAGQVVAIDGETLRGGFDKASGKSAIHMVSAWATANQIHLGQVVVDAKSNEITAIPKLLELLEITGGIVTIDAMRCQTAIAEAIIAKKADYVLAVKDNQPTLHAGIMAYFLDRMEGNFPGVKVSCYQTREQGHGRIEQRTYMVCDAPTDLPDRGRWKGLRRIGIAIRDTVRGGKPADEIHCDILSKRMSARSFGAAARDHRGIESMHWQLDVTFGEHHCRTRKGRANANFSILRLTALSLLKNEKTAKVGIKNKRLTAGWNDL